MIQAFGEFELDGDLFELRRGGRPVRLEPKAFNVLAYLIAHRDRVVGKQELFEQLWPGEFVTDSALTYCIKAARRALDDDGVNQQVIATVQRRGYRFVAALTGEHGAPSTATPPPAGEALRPDTPFIGREQVMATLERALAGAAGGRGGLVLLAGEPGIGKTRTCDELAQVARRRAIPALIGRCYEGEGAPPFWPWVQILRALLRGVFPAELPSLPSHIAGDLVQLLPELSDRLKVPAPRPAEDHTPRARVQLFESVRQFLESASRTQPLVLILDDIHWADQPSLLLLQYIARTLADSRLLVLATYRDTDVRPRQPIALALGDLVRASNSLRIRLDGLSAEDVARFVEQTVGRAAAVSLVTALHQETEGNPFFVTEIVRLLVDGGQLDRLESAALTLAVPSTVRDAIERRMAQLSPACNDLLMAAAVIGRDFDVITLAQTWNPAADTAPPPRSVLDLLDEARTARIIEAGGAPATYRFVHALIRETLYDALPTADRVRFHQRAGESLERHAAGVSLSELAHHFSQAAAGGDVRKGAAYSIRAAEFAADRLAYEGAVLHYDRAIQFSHLDPELGRRRAALQVELGQNQWRAGDFARARATFQAAAEAARANGEAEHLARAALGYGGGFRGFTLGALDPVLIDLLDEALAALPPHDSALRAQVTARQALALYDTPDSLARRDALSQSAVAMARSAGDAASHLGALCCRHWAIWGPDNLADRTAVATEMVALAERVDDHEMALQAHRFRLVDALEIGDIDQVDADQAACEALGERLRQPYYTWYVLAFRALRAFLDGRFDESERLSQEALAVGQRAQTSNVSQMYGAQMLALRREQGRSAEVEPMLQGLVAQFPTVPSWRCGLAYVLNELDRRDDARAQFEILAADEFSGIPRDAFWLVAMLGTIEVCVSLADRERAAVLYRLVRPYADHFAVNVVGTCVSSIARGLGCLAGLLSDADEAKQHFESAIALESRLGARPLLAHSQHDYGAMLLQHDGKGDREKARQLLGAAHATFEQLGMQSFAERAGRLRALANRQPRTRAAARPKLTALRRR